MKAVLLSAFLLISLINHSLADCREAYEKASHIRDIRNEAIVGVVIVGSGAGAFLIPAGASIFSASYFLFIAGAWPLTDYKRQGLELYSNKFDKILEAFDAAKAGKENKYLSKIIKRSIEEYGAEQTEMSAAHARQILVEGFANESFCPVIKTHRDGSVKRAVYNRHALIKFIAERL